ncbi:MAG: dihydropyrimidinase [Candidatus Brocadiia bacterium]
MDIKIKGGTVITSAKTFKADIGIDKGKVTKISPQIKEEAELEIDASGKYVMPGGVDVHTHFDMPFGGTVTADDFHTGTVAAACGGTTTVIDFAIQQKGHSLKDALETWRDKAKNKAVIDYSFHIAITEVTKKTESELSDLAKNGITSVKLFMAYKDSLMVDDATLHNVMTMAKDLGLLTMLHCENGMMIDSLQKKYLSEGKTRPIYHALSRPPELEDEAVHRAIALAGMAEAPIYIVHLSSGNALEEVKLARLNKQPVFAETCPHYLLLSLDKYKPNSFETAKFVMSPPLRAKNHIPALWKGIAAGHIQAVSSDHCSFNFAYQKELGRDDFSKIPNGVPGVETRLAILYNEGVMSKRIDLNKMVDIFATAPAKIFGLYPQKGDIAINGDADIIIFDPDRRFIRNAHKLHQNVDYTPFEGYRGRGAVTNVISKGKLIVKNKSFIGNKGDGAFLPRRKFDL